MRQIFMIFQTDLELTIEGKNGSKYSYAYIGPLDHEEYNSEQLAKNALEAYLNLSEDEGTFAILPVYKRN